MRLLVISTAPFIYEDNSISAYTPYVEELSIWYKYTDSIAFCCPVWKNSKGLLISQLPFEFSLHFKLIDFSLNSGVAIVKSGFAVLYNFIILIKAIIWADHIHLRCPGNVGLLACILQVFFPFKQKTAKYAGNWDPKSKQPWSYRMQKWILNNSFLTRNMQVLVYGEWPNQSKNIKPFFTATYSEAEKIPLVPKEIESKINFIFVGTLVKGKNPLYAMQLVEKLHDNGYIVHLDIYGEGEERSILEKYISDHQLEEWIQLKGNHSKEIVKIAYQQSHFVILPSISEGWPKAIAEGMFWGCVPLGTAVSCVPFMLDSGNRGALLEMELEKDLLQMEAILNDQHIFDTLRDKASAWSRKYTVDVFEEDIKKLLQS
jgi:glycosyltransferase involved in cell wall biosynthesis